MDVTPLISAGFNIINSYGLNYFSVNRVKYSGNIIITPNYIDNWLINEKKIDDISNFEVLYSLIEDAEILLIGLGPYYNIKRNFLREKIKNYFFHINPTLSIELMNSPAACRTYNVILSESRKLVACLISVSE